MTRICTYHQPDHHVTVEHINYVDLSPFPTDLDMQLPCYRSTVSTYVAQAKVGDFTDDLNRLKMLSYFSLAMQLMFVNRKAWFTLTPRFAEGAGKPPHHEHDAARYMMDLVTYLSRQQLPIIWKEDGRGYLIGTGGVIKRKWDLLSGSVPF